MANPKEEYSTEKPATNTASASGISKGKLDGGSCRTIDELSLATDHWPLITVPYVQKLQRLLVTPSVKKCNI
jgi:hypothetical protein